VFVPGVTLLNIFIVDNTSVAVNLGRFFIIGGATLVLDDLTDVNRHLASGLYWLKAKVGRAPKLVSALHLIAGTVSAYIFAAVTLGVATNPDWVTTANLIVIGTLFITSLTSFIFLKRRFWQKIEP
jgi:hypothetical protein